MIRESPSCGGRSGAGNTGAVFLLRRRKLFQQISDVDGQLREDAYRDIICKWKNRGRCIFFVPVHGGALLGRIDDPVFPDTGPGVQSVLGGIIHPAAGRGDDFDHQIRSSIASAVVQLGLVADYGDIWFHPVFVLRVQIDGEGGRIYLTCAVMVADILSQNESELGNELLMNPTRRRHIVELAADQFRPLAFREVPVIF